MTDKLTLKLKDTIVEVTMDDNGRYSLNDLYKASCKGRSKAPQQFLRSQRELDVVKTWECDTQQNAACEKSDKEGFTHLSDFENYVVQTKINRATKTFASRKVVLKYAMFIDKDFYESVVSAFDSLVIGDVQEAADIASSVALTPEIIAKQQKVQKALTDTIKEVYGSDSKRYIHYFRLVSKAVTGYTPQNLTDGSKSAADWIINDGHLPAMNALIATHTMVLSLLKAGVTDYHVIATALGVSTTVNKDIMNQIEKLTL